MKKDATIDVTQLYRYTLLREWDSNAPRVAFVMLNPSTGDSEIDDNTIIRCINFAQLWEYGSIEVVNLFGYRSKNFDYIKGVSNPIGNENNEFIRKVVNSANIVVAAWGDNGTYLSRDEEVIDLISKMKDIYCLGKTSKGNPRHPLYLDSSTMLEMYKPRDESLPMKDNEELQQILNENKPKNNNKTSDDIRGYGGLALFALLVIIALIFGYMENTSSTKSKTNSQSQNTSSSNNTNYLVTNRTSINEMISQYNSMNLFSSVAEYPEGVNNTLFSKQTNTGFAMLLNGKDLDHIESANVWLELVDIQDAERSMLLLKGFFGHMFPSDFGVKTATWAFKQITDMDTNGSITERTMISEGNKITVEHLQNQKNDTYYIHIEKAL